MLTDYKEAQNQSDLPYNNVQSESFLGTSTLMCSDDKLGISQIEDIQHVSFWVEDVCQLTIGLIGIISNIIAIPTLCSREMKSIFNKLLICLLVLHTIFISGVLLTQTMWPARESFGKSNDWFIILFSFVLYPLEQLMLYSSTFITILMARQRYLAIRHPIEYRNSTIALNPWIPAIKSVFVVLIAASLFTLPLYFETSVKSVDVRMFHDINSTHFQYVSTI